MLAAGTSRKPPKPTTAIIKISRTGTAPSYKKPGRANPPNMLKRHW